METRYTPTNWQNQIKDVDGTIVQKGTPLNATNLNKIESELVRLSPAIDEIELTNGEVVKVNGRIDLSNTEISKTNTRIDLTDNEVAKANTEITKVNNRVDLANTEISKQKGDISTLESSLKATQTSIGKPNGIASLGSNGIIPASQLPSQVKEMRVVANIAARDALEKFEALRVMVLDATADTTVKSGWAEYVWDGSKFFKTAEMEGLDVVIKWANVEEKPTSFPPISHGHTIAQVSNLGDELNKKFDKTGGTISGIITLQDTTISAETITFDGSTAAGMRVTNKNGYVSIAPLNGSGAHFYTDRGIFFFNKPIASTVSTFTSYITDLLLQRANVTKLTLGATEATFEDKVKAPSFVQADGKAIETTDGATAKVNTHAGDKVLHITSLERTAWNDAIATINGHKADKVLHITSAERVAWNGMLMSLSNHTGDGTVHITSAERVAWNGALEILGTHETKLAELSKHTHSYNDLTNKPSIPSKTSQLTNDSGLMQSNAARITVSATAPANPKPNDIWIVI